MLGEGFRTCLAGAVPSHTGLLSIRVSHRTSMLISPHTSHTGIEMQDNHFHEETLARRLSKHSTRQTSPSAAQNLSSQKTQASSSSQFHQTQNHVSPPTLNSTHQVSPHSKAKPTSSMPQPCFSTPKRFVQFIAFLVYIKYRVFLVPYYTSPYSQTINGINSRFFVLCCGKPANIFGTKIT